MAWRNARLRAEQYTFCRGYQCREICKAASRWCRRCWRSIPETTRGYITDCAGFLAAHSEDAAATLCLEAAVGQADRELEELRRAAA